MKEQIVKVTVNGIESNGQIQLIDNTIIINFGLTKQKIDFNDIKVIDKVLNELQIVLSDNSLIRLQFEDYLVAYKILNDFLTQKEEQQKNTKNFIKCKECGEKNNTNNYECSNCGFPIKRKQVFNKKNVLIMFCLILIGSVIVGSKIILPKILIHLEEKKYTDEKCFVFENGTITDYDSNCPLEVVIPKNINGIKVTEIGKDAFYEKGIISVVFPDGLKKIQNGSFERNNLTSLVIPDSVTKIYANAFSNNQLKKVQLSKNLTLIGSWSFDFNLIEEITIPDKVIQINQEAFANNNLKKVIIGTSVKNIEYAALGQYDGEEFVGNSEHNQKLTSIINKSGKQFDWYDVLAYDNVYGGSEMWLETGSIKTNFGTIIISK